MAKVLVTESALEDIADAIRGKNGQQTTYKPGEMASAIGAIPTPTGTKQITANGTGIDVAQYASADVAVPNSYVAGDEGKVVSNGALVAQGSDTVTQNDTYDTTLINSLTVNVSGGITPTGTKQISITQNGTTTEDVTNYASAEISVNVSGGGGLSADAVAAGTVSGDIVLSDSTTSVRQYAFQNCTNITGLTANGVTTFGTAAFQFCHFNTNKLYLPECTTLNTYVFNPGNNAGQITYLILPKVTAIPVDAFRGNRLSYIDLGASCESIASRGLSSQAGTANVQVLVLRRTAGVTSLANANGFESGISSSTRIYVPSALKSAYQAASGWATRYASYPDLFQNLEGSPYENAYVDGTPIS